MWKFEIGIGIVPIIIISFVIGVIVGVRSEKADSKRIIELQERVKYLEELRKPVAVDFDGGNRG